jgi:acyl-CoA synthetase (AMP-forming)/AMP-acid ligase II
VPEDYASLQTLLSHGEEDWVDVQDADNTAAAYFSTSGTSGLPKAAIISHSYLTSQGHIQLDNASATHKVNNSPTSYLIALPPFHAYIFPIQHSLPLRSGTPVYVMPRYNPEGFLSAIEQFQISRIAVVPTILTSMCKSPLCNRNSMKSLRRIYVAGSITKKEMQQQLYELISPAARIENLYGMTESGWTASTWRGRKKDQTGSIGTPLPGIELR